MIINTDAYREALFAPGQNYSFDNDEECDESCRRCAEAFRLEHHRPEGRKNADRWLRAAAYEFIQAALYDQDGWEYLEARIDAYGRRQRGVKGNPNLFQTGLLAIFAHVNESRADHGKGYARSALTSADRKRMGSQLYYAFRHLVPPLFLEAFISEVGGSRISRNSERKFVEPKYREWVIDQLSRSDHQADWDVEYEDDLRAEASKRAAQLEFDEEEVDEDGWA